MVDQTDKNGTWSKERKKINRTAIISVVLAAIIVTAFFAGYFVRGTVEPAESQEMTALMKIIKETWFNEKNTEELSAEFVEKVIRPYDPYAAYYSPKEYRSVLEEDKGRYSGVGIGIAEDNNTGEVKVAKVYLNSPAYENLETGDFLVAGIRKGGTAYTDFKGAVAEFNQDKDENERITVLYVVNKFFAEFKGGDEIKLKIRRGDTEIDFTLIKEDYIVSYVEYKDNEKYYYFSTDTDGFKGRESDDADKILPTLSDDTAYIKLYEFEGGAAEQFESALNFMIARGRTKLILDLRDNGGGIVDILLKIASYLINNNGAANIRVLKYKNKTAESHYSTVNRFKGVTDISVIANAGTASASECLIGALIDYGDNARYNGARFGYDRLVITPKKDANGDDVYRTYGKGIMQTTYGLPSGGALKLTTAKIYWPIQSICVQDVGIQTVSENCVSDENAIARANEVLHPLP